MAKIALMREKLGSRLSDFSVVLSDIISLRLAERMVQSLLNLIICYSSGSTMSPHRST